MGRGAKLVDEETHVIFTVNVAENAVGMVGILFLVRYHGLLGSEMLEAVFERTLDLHLERSNAGEGLLEAGRLLGLCRSKQADSESLEGIF
jgi:hypothetical protein